MAEAADLHLKTTDMHCRSCSMLVDMIVGELDGVESVSTDHATGQTRVRVDPDVVDIEAIIAAIRAAGYDAEPA